MGRRLVACALVTLVAAAPAVAASPFGAKSGTVTLSNTAPSARPVVVTVKLSYEMQCGYPGTGSIVVDLSKQMAVAPAAIRSAGAVLVNGTAAKGVTVTGDTVTVPLPKRPRIMCDVIGPGSVTITFTKKADVGNPAQVARYNITAKRSNLSGTAGTFLLGFTIS